MNRKHASIALVVMSLLCAASHGQGTPPSQEGGDGEETSSRCGRWHEGPLNWVITSAVPPKQLEPVDGSIGCSTIPCMLDGWRRWTRFLTPSSPFEVRNKLWFFNTDSLTSESARREVLKISVIPVIPVLPVILVILSFLFAGSAHAAPSSPVRNTSAFAAVTPDAIPQDAHVDGRGTATARVLDWIYELDSAWTTSEGSWGFLSKMPRAFMERNSGRVIMFVTLDGETATDAKAADSDSSTPSRVDASAAPRTVRALRSLRSVQFQRAGDGSAASGGTNGGTSGATRDITGDATQGTGDVGRGEAVFYRFAPGPCVRDPQQEAGPSQSPWWRAAETGFVPEASADAEFPAVVHRVAATELDAQTPASWQDVLGTTKERQAGLERHERAASMFRQIESGTLVPVASVDVQRAQALDGAPVLGAPLVEILAWIESTDASQAMRRLTGEVEFADRIRADLRAYLQAVRAYELVALVDERVPIGSREVASLTMHPTWESDAWPLLKLSIEAREAREDARRRFANVALRVAAKTNFPEKAADRLRDRLALVACNLPANFTWDAGFEDAVASHLEKACRARMESVAIDLESCTVTAQTAAFEVFGYAWSCEGAMSPSQEALRASDFERMLAPLREAAAGGKLLIGGVDLADLAVARVRAHFAGEPARWKPWLVFPASNAEPASAVTAEILSNITDEYEDLTQDLLQTYGRVPPGRERLPAGFPLPELSAYSVDWSIDNVLSDDCERQPRTLPMMRGFAVNFSDGRIYLTKW